MVRKELREHIFKMLFQIEFNDPQEMPEQIEYYFSTLEDAAGSLFCAGRTEYTDGDRGIG